MKTIVWFVLVLSALSAAGKVIQGKLGKKTTIECGMDAVKSITWDHGVDLIITVDMKTGFSRRGNSELATQRSKVPGTGSLVITDLKKEDLGQFTCKADGKSQEHTLFVLLVSVSPSRELQLGSNAMLQCAVIGLEGQGNWKRPDGSKPTGSDVILKPVAHSDAGTWTCSFTHAGQTYSENIDITIKGLDPTTAMTPSQPKNQDKGVASSSDVSGDASLVLGLNWWMWVAVGVSGLVVVFLMVSIIVLYKRIQRRKKRHLKMKNGRPQKPRQYCQCDHSTAAAKPKQGRRRDKPSTLPPLLMV